MLAQDFENRLKAHVDFPSPSQVASEIVSLARDPEIEIARVANAVGRDPAMTAKILRIANSAFYAQRRPSQNLRQALIVIGLNAALTLALSFSLVSTMRALRPTGIEYPRFWRRSLLAATAARAFGEVSKSGREEDIFLAGLLQDMAVLALDRVARDFYSKLSQPSTHADWIAYEIQELGRDHAYYGAVLLKYWNLPERIWKAVEHSHAPEKLDSNCDDGRYARCLSLGSDLAEAVLSTNRPAALSALAARSRKLLGLRDEQFTEIVTRILGLIPETEALYDTSILDPEEAEALLAEARELLAVRNLHALQEVSALQATTSVLLSRTEELEDASRRDPLTGALNRPWFDRLMDREFTQALMFGRTLSVAQIDLDQFRKVNDRYGTDTGDQVLRSCAQTIQQCVRGSDLLARFSGEEFMVVLPGAEMDIARQVAQRILAALSSTDHGSASAGPISITASVGIATCTPQHRFPTALALLEAADHALYAAKLRGRNRIEFFEELAHDASRAVGTHAR